MEPTSGTGGSASGTTPSGVSSHSTTASSSQSATGSHSTGATQSPSAPAAISRSEQKKAKAVNDAIDKSLRADKERLQKERGAKLLILGPSETGKTTVLKQLKLLYGRKGLDAERQTYRRVVHLNTMKAIQALSYGLQRTNIPLEHAENIAHLETVMRLETTLKRYSITSIGFTNPAIPRKITDAKAETDMFLEMVPAIKALWADGGIQETYRTVTNLNLQDSAKYFLDSVDRIADLNYVPTDDDILQARVRTLAVSEHLFNIDGVTYKIFDVGGQKSLRKYWAPYFDDVNAIIFMVALSAYDQPCEDDERLNRLEECMSLFNSIANHKLFEMTSFLLFLNKIDIFQQKLDAGSLVSTYFPDYRGPNDYMNTTLYFQQRFLQQCKDTAKQVYTHFTHATDTNQMRVIVVAVNAIVQRLNLRSSGLL
ncbi:guanine nucleotide binding protein, alpha subunit [Gamsiella multidivaricata]|uniref:guanine nucleotide binding protein, alpha subunit n=1 Tax=Gamsiella multidivaricata TaxID=101098 RepID=UPI0022211C88|nr:guanine nucleotide binding protein, alpha subunit [Gamsiella multidivaricata]KAI7823776.1 guanine nucleotide binding protein, alpha subunit [Gamsiella multidivaricata]